MLRDAKKYVMEHKRGQKHKDIHIASEFEFSSMTMSFS